MFTVFLSTILVLVVIFSSLYGVWNFFNTRRSKDAGRSITYFVLLNVLVSKFGTAIGFVLIYYFAHNSFGSHWLFYAFICWLMFVLDEIGQTIGSNYS